MSAHPSDPSPDVAPNSPLHAASGQASAGSFWSHVSAAPAPVVGIINQREQWPWNVVFDRARPLPTVLEWRLDSIFGGDPALPDNLPAPDSIPAPPVPILLTARHPDEGGDHNLDADQRCALLLHFLPLADAIDIELRAIGEMEPVLAAAREQGVAVVVSAHDFERTPAADDLRQTIRRATDAGADAVKIATRTDDAAALVRLLGLLDERSPDDLPLIVMGMGRLGKVSRLAAVACGSPLAYGHLGHANVSGQWHAVELAEALIRQSEPHDPLD